MVVTWLSGGPRWLACGVTVRHERRAGRVIMNEPEDRASQMLSEVKKHFDVVAESLEGKIQLVAEGVLNVNEKLDRLKDEMHRESEETRALIKLSYAELDRRLTTLEGTVDSLIRRVGTIEAQQS